MSRVSVDMKYTDNGSVPVGYKEMDKNHGANQKIYSSRIDDHVLKIPIDNNAFGLSVEERAANQVNAHEKYPHLFPKTEKAGEKAVKQEYVPEGKPLREIMKNREFDNAVKVFTYLKELHDNGDVHGDVNSDNIGIFGNGYISRDIETVGPGNPSKDLGRVLKSGERHQPGFMPEVIERVYGSSVLEDLKN